MLWCHIPVPTCWLFLILGPANLGMGPGQLWLCNFWHMFTISSPSAKSNKVFLSSVLWTTTCSTVVCSYTRPAIMSRFVYTRDNGFPLRSSIVKLTTLLPISRNWYWGCTISWWCWHHATSIFFQKQLCNLYHRYFSNIFSRLLPCPNTETTQTNGIYCPIESQLILLLWRWLSSHQLLMLFFSCWLVMHVIVSLTTSLDCDSHGPPLHIGHLFTLCIPLPRGQGPSSWSVTHALVHLAWLSLSLTLSAKICHASLLSLTLSLSHFLYYLLTSHPVVLHEGSHSKSRPRHQYS